MDNGKGKKVFRDSPYDMESCGHCGSWRISYESDIKDAYERWSPITCDECGKESYEVWKGNKLISVLTVHYEEEQELTPFPTPEIPESLPDPDPEPDYKGSPMKWLQWFKKRVNKRKNKQVEDISF